MEVKSARFGLAWQQSVKEMKKGTVSLESLFFQREHFLTAKVAATDELIAGIPLKPSILSTL